MKNLTKSLLAFAAAGALALGAAAPASAAPALHPDADANGVLSQSQRVTIGDDIDFNVTLRAGCHNYFASSPWMQAIVVNYAEEGYSWDIGVAHKGIFADAWDINTWGIEWSEEDGAFEMVRSLEADRGAFTQGAWVERDLAARAHGYTTFTFQKINPKGKEVGSPIEVTFQRPLINCDGTGGASSKNWIFED